MLLRNILVLSLALFLATFSAQDGGGGGVETQRHLCETGHAKCVPGKGCIAVTSSDCLCPEAGCPFPQKCDCKGSCSAHTCSSNRACLKFKSDNLCERAVCSEGHCIVEPKSCANCNPKTGCPSTKTGATTTTTTNTNTNTAQDSSTQVNKEGGDWDDDWSGPSTEFPKPLIAAILIYCMCFVAIVLGMAVLSWGARRVGY